MQTGQLTWTMLNFKNMARVTRTFKLELGPLRARGVPAILLSVSGIVLASGVAKLLAENPAGLTETIREASRFMGIVRSENATMLENPK